MKFKFLLIVILSSITIYSQNITTDLPVNSPQTPTTANLGKFGEVQVNESTGLISPSIPLFDYNAGKITIPISLNYNGNGVRVNQDSNWAGINWNINPGGVITRMVNDEADEKINAAHKLYLSEQELDNLPGVRQLNPNSCILNPNTQWYETIGSMRSAGFDTEVDVFNYSFLGYSGSFIFDKDMKAHLVKYDKELKIEFFYQANNKSEIKITTPDGNKYFFGGTTASESSSTSVNNGAGSTVNNAPTQNAFYLYKIEFLTGGYVNFNYSVHDTTCSITKIGITESASLSDLYGNIPCNKTTRDVFSDVERFVLLNSISNSFNTQTVTFNSNFTGECNRLIKLNDIHLKNGVNKIKKVSLNYLTIDNEILASERKFFLNRVDFFDKNDAFVQDYELIYNNPQLFPSKNSFAQDELGYYNGKTANTTLLPKTTDNYLNTNCHFGLADRKASLSDSFIGTLYEIKYPTGGKMNFEYELPYKGVEDVYESHYFNIFKRNPLSNNTSSSIISTANNQMTYSSGDFQPYPYNLGDMRTDSNGNVVYNHVKGNLNFNVNGTYSHPFEVRLLAKKNGGTQVYTQIFNFNASNVNETLNKPIELSFPEGSYKFELILILNNADGNVNNTNSVVVTAQLNIPATTTPTYFPGLRTKRVITDDSNGNVSTTRYYYNYLENITQEAYVYNPNFVFMTYTPNPNNVNYPLVLVHNLSTNSVKNVYNSNGGQHTYNYITVSYGGDSFENGGKQMLFKKYYDRVPIVYDIEPCYGPVPFENEIATSYVSNAYNDSYQNTVLQEELFFNNNLSKLKKTKYNYLPEVNKVVSNIKLYKFCSSCLTQFNGDNLHLLYDTTSYKYRLISTETEEYFGVNQTIKSKVSQSYSNDKVSLPKSIETVSSSGDTKKTNVYYVSDASLIPSLTAPEITNLNTMQTLNNVSQVVKTQTLTNNIVDETKQVYFNNFSGKILPKTVSASKGIASLEDKVEFIQYDSYGNPTLMRKKDGILIKKVYNSNQQVILNIENFTASTFDDININNVDCYYQDTYPDSFITKYEYDIVTNNLIKVTDPKCDIITYHYDDFNRLEYVKDKVGNIISENTYHYKN